MKSEPILDDLITHSENGAGQTQSLRAHLEGVAERAAGFAEAFGSAAFARWLGWWHDAGKVAPDVQAYLRGETEAARGPDHSSAGMLEAAAQMEPLAFNVAGHHGGLPDYSYLEDRIARKKRESLDTEAHFDAEKMKKERNKTRVPRSQSPEACAPQPPHLETHDT